MAIDPSPDEVASPPVGTAVAAPIPAQRGGRTRAVRRRARAIGTAARSAVLLALLALAFAQATRSPALDRAREAERGGAYAPAVRDALAHLSRRPWSREAALVAARCLSRLDFADLAEPNYRRAGRLSAEDRHYWAYGLVRANRREQAISAYGAILDDHPGDVSALQMTIGVLMTQSRWVDARVVARRLTGLPDGPATVYLPVSAAGGWTLERAEVPSVAVIGWTLTGLIEHDSGDFELAAAAFERALERDPGLRSVPLDPDLFRSYLAEDLVRVGRSDDAIRLLTSDPGLGERPRLLALLGQAYDQKGEQAEAERVWLRALEREPDQTRALVGLGRLELQRARPEAAIAYLVRAIEHAPESYRAHYILARAYRMSGREELARRHQEIANRVRTAADAEPTIRTRPDTAPADAGGR